MKTMTTALLICMACCSLVLAEDWQCLGGVLQESEFAAQVQVVTREKGPSVQRLARLYWEDDGFVRSGELESLRPWFPFQHLAEGDALRTRFVFYGRGQHLMTLEAENGFIQYPGPTADPYSNAGCIFSGSVIEFHDLLMRARYLRQRGVPINGNLVPTVWGFASRREELCADLTGLTWHDVLESVHAMLELEYEYPRIEDRSALVPLRAYCAALRYPCQPAASLADAHAITDPFYASLALGAMAAQTIHDDADHARKLLYAAEQTALDIDHWTTSDATSLGYLFQVIPLFPEGYFESLLLASRRNLAKWEANSAEKAQPMKALTEVTIQIDPTEAVSLLFDVTHYGHHCWESARAIGRTLLRQPPDEAWEAITKVSREDHAVFSYLAAGYLAEVAKDDLPGALERLKTLRDWQQLTVGVQTGYYLLENGENEKVSALLDFLTPLAEELEQFKGSVVALRARLEAAATAKDDSTVREVGAEMIARFIEKPDMNRFQQIANARRITFANRTQAVAFVTAGLPLARQIEGASFRCSVKGGGWSDYRLLTLVAASADHAELAFRACHDVREINARLSLLLDAYERANPLPSPLQDWPLTGGTARAAEIKIADKAMSQPSQ